MLLNCFVGEDSWSPLDCKEIQPVHSEGDQPWDFFGRNDAKAETPILWQPHVKSWLIWKDSDAGRDWGQEEKGTTEDEMAGWHHWLVGRESEWTPVVGDEQGGLARSDSWGCKELDTTERLNWTELKVFDPRNQLEKCSPPTSSSSSGFIKRHNFHTCFNFSQRSCEHAGAGKTHLQPRFLQAPHGPPSFPLIWLQGNVLFCFKVFWCESESISCSVLSDSFATPWTVARQAPLSVRFSRQESWSGLPFPSPGDLPDPGIELRSPAF